MELTDLFGALRRWWYLAVVVALLAVGAGLGLSELRGPSYVATSSVVLVPPQSTVVGAATTSSYAPSNPLLYLGSLTQSRDVVLEALNSTEVADRIADRYPSASLTASPAAASSGPIVVLSVTGRSSSEALSAMAYAGQQVPVVLTEIQQRLKVDDVSRVTSFTLTADTKAETSHKSQLQLGILGAVGVGVVGLFLIAVWDHLIRTRVHARRPRAERVAGADARSEVVAPAEDTPPSLGSSGSGGSGGSGDRDGGPLETALAGSAGERR